MDKNKELIKVGRTVSKILRNHPSQLEIKVKKILDDNHIEYKFQHAVFNWVGSKPKYINGFYIPTFYIKDKNLVLDVEDIPRRMSKEERECLVSANNSRIYNTDELEWDAQILKIREYDLLCPSFAAELVAVLK